VLLTESSVFTLHRNNRNLLTNNQFHVKYFKRGPTWRNYAQRTAKTQPNTSFNTTLEESIK